jgi:hypothetical protein
MATIRTLLSDAAKFLALLLLGAICTLLSIACLPSLCFGIALLTQQASAWLHTSQWHALPLAALLQDVGHVPQLDSPWLQPGIERVLSLESAPTLIAAAILVWIAGLLVFHRALKMWRPAASLF